MGEQKSAGMATYVVTRVFRARDGIIRVPGDPDRGTVAADYDEAARLRSAGCIGGIAKVAKVEPEKKKETMAELKDRKKAERAAKKAAKVN